MSLKRMRRVQKLGLCKAEVNPALAFLLQQERGHVYMHCKIEDIPNCPVFQWSWGALIS